MCSVTPGKERHSLRTHSAFMSPSSYESPLPECRRHMKRRLAGWRPLYQSDLPHLSGPDPGHQSGTMVRTLRRSITTSNSAGSRLDPALICHQLALRLVCRYVKRLSLFLHRGGNRNRSWSRQRRPPSSRDHRTQDIPFIKTFNGNDYCASSGSSHILTVSTRGSQRHLRSWCCSARRASVPLNGPRFRPPVLGPYTEGERS